MQTRYTYKTKDKYIFKKKEREPKGNDAVAWR